MRKTKKLIALFMVLMMCLSLAACGSDAPDVQPAIDSYNRVSDSFNRFAALVNENIDVFPAEDIEMYNGIADLLNEYADKLENGTEFTQEEIDEMIEMFDELDVALKEILAEYE